MRLLALLVLVTVLLPHQAAASDRHQDCKNYGAERTVRCIAQKQDPPGGVSKALSVWRCESNFGTEPPHSDSYHGPYQFSLSTYASQQDSMPRIVRWYDLSALVHDMRSNIITAVAWAARNSWSPWEGCA